MQWYYNLPRGDESFQQLTILPSNFDDDAMRSLAGPGILVLFGGESVECVVDRGFGDERLSFESDSLPISVPRGARLCRAQGSSRGFFVFYSEVLVPIIASEPQQLLLADCGFQPT